MSEIVIYAWLGEDEFGSSVTGLKQAVCPAGTIPIVGMGYHFDKILAVRDQFEQQARLFGKKIYLCEFVLRSIHNSTDAGAPNQAIIDATMTPVPKLDPDVLRIALQLQEIMDRRFPSR